MKRLTAFLIFACLYNSAFGLVVLDPNYTAEIYAVYKSSQAEKPMKMTFDDEGNMYITQLPSYDIIWRIDPNANVSKFITGIRTPRGIDWGGGTSFGDYLYVTSTDRDRVYKVSKTGASSYFSSAGNGPVSVKIDKSGNYSGYMYVGTAGNDRVYKVNPSGNVSTFSSFPGTYSHGGLYSMDFDPGTDYGGSMFVGTSYCCGSGGPNGLFKMNTNGSVTKWPGFNYVQTIEFDHVGLFGGFMYIHAHLSGAGRGMVRVKPDKTGTLFIQTTYDDMRAWKFGEDGALYVAEYSSSSRTVIVSRIFPTPVPITLDVKPESCPNPLNLNSKGILSAAILGSKEFDVNTIDVNTILLNETSPVRISLEDVAAPVTDANDCNCVNAGSDGYIDLNLGFKNQRIVDRLFEESSDYDKGQVLGLQLKGKLLDGRYIVGSDCVVLIGNVPKFVLARQADLNTDGIVNMLDLAIFAEYWLESSTP
ncbi:MAG: hypothetical protein ACYSUK_11365 [Planctomycetota bacterium]